MKRYLFIVVVVILAISAIAFSQTAPSAAPAPAAPAPIKVELSADLKFKIRDVQNNIHNLNDQYVQMQKYITDVTEKFKVEQAKLQPLVDEAFKEARLSKTDHEFDPETLAFVKKAPPAPEKK